MHAHTHLYTYLKPIFAHMQNETMVSKYTTQHRQQIPVLVIKKHVIHDINHK